MAPGAVGGAQDVVGPEVEDVELDDVAGGLPRAPLEDGEEEDVLARLVQRHELGGRGGGAGDDDGAMHPVDYVAADGAGVRPPVSNPSRASPPPREPAFGAYSLGVDLPDALPLTDVLDATEGGVRRDRAGSGESWGGEGWGGEGWGVAIPAAELRARRGELPPRGAVLRVRGEAPETESELARLGIVAEVATEDRPGARLWTVDPLAARVHRETAPPRGSAIDLGCGAGRNAVWLAANGWTVTAVDRLAENVATARGLAARHGVALEARAERIETTLASGEGYDLALLGFCWDAAWISGLAGLVRPGGTLAVATFSLAHRAASGHPARERCLAPEDVARLARDFAVVRHEDAPRPDRLATELVAVRKR